MSERSRSRSPQRGYNRNPVRSKSPYRHHNRSPVRHHSPPRNYYGGPNYGNWGLGITSGLLLGTALGSTINPYNPYYVSPYIQPYGVNYIPVEYDIYGRPIRYYR